MPRDHGGYIISDVNIWTPHAIRTIVHAVKSDFIDRLGGFGAYSLYVEGQIQYLMDDGFILKGNGLLRLSKKGRDACSHPKGISGIEEEIKQKEKEGTNINRRECSINYYFSRYVCRHPCGYIVR